MAGFLSGRVVVLSEQSLEFLTPLLLSLPRTSSRMF